MNNLHIEASTEPPAIQGRTDRFWAGIDENLKLLKTLGSKSLLISHHAP